MKRLSDVVRDLDRAPPSAADGGHKVVPLWDLTAPRVEPGPGGDERLAYARGLADGRREALAELEALRHDIDRQVFEAVACARVADNVQVADQSTRELAASLAAIEERLHGLVLDMLEPLVAARYDAGSREAFVAAVMRSVQVQGATSVRICGPDAVIGEMSRRLTSLGVSHHAVAGPGVEIVAELDETRIVSQLAGLVEQTKELLA